MTDDLHDFSHLEAHLATQRRALLLREAWKPALAGAAGATAIIGAVVVGVWLAGPRFSYQEVVVDHVVQKDVSVDHIVPHDVLVDRIVPHDVPIAIPQIVITRTPQERAFADSRDFAAAPMHGRIVPSRNERSLSFDDGQDYVPTDPRMAADAAPFVGDLGLCSKIAGDEDRYHCEALHDGVVVPVRQRPLGRPT